MLSVAKQDDDNGYGDNRRLLLCRLADTTTATQITTPDSSRQTVGPSPLTLPLLGNWTFLAGYWILIRYYRHFPAIRHKANICVQTGEI